MTPTHHDPDDYYGALRLQYEAFEREALRRRNEGEGDYRAQVWYYLPGGRRSGWPTWRESRVPTSWNFRARTSRVTLA